MQWTTVTIRSSRVFSAGFLTVLLSGCQMLVCPWHDEIAHAPDVTTNSAEYARSLDVEPAVRNRDCEESTVLMADGTVTHGPLFFEDPYETAGSDDGHFAWTIEDHAYFFSGQFRFLLNYALMPVSVVDTPPWRLMASDGAPSRHVLWMPHDAGRWRSESAN